MVWICPAPCRFRGHGGFFDASAKSRISPNHFSPIAANDESRRAGNALFSRTLLIKPGCTFDELPWLGAVADRSMDFRAIPLGPGGAKGITRRFLSPNREAPNR